MKCHTESLKLPKRAERRAHEARIMKKKADIFLSQMPHQLVEQQFADLRASGKKSPIRKNKKWKWSKWKLTTRQELIADLSFKEQLLEANCSKFVN